ncbi:MAG: hypothetical protein ABL907_12250, partial [Hyphomicrobium sp.]
MPLRDGVTISVLTERHLLIWAGRGRQIHRYRFWFGCYPDLLCFRTLRAPDPPPAIPDLITQRIQ